MYSIVLCVTILHFIASHLTLYYTADANVLELHCSLLSCNITTAVAAAAATATVTAVWSVSTTSEHNKSYQREEGGGK